LPTVYLVTGPTQSNKTTLLANWAEGRHDVGGLLSPVIFGKRHFQNLRTKEWRPMEADINDENVEQVGRYTFSKATFDWANNILIQAASQPDINYLIIDEIGPLELQGKGLTAALDHILYNIPEHLNLVLVIREKIAESVVLIYELKKYNVEPFDFPVSEN
jgi:nucleoside-triphosphatase THEP1